MKLIRRKNLAAAIAAQARTRAALGDGLGAAADFTRAILRSPLPEYYAERACALAAAGRIKAALRGLDQRHERHGLLLALQHLTIDLELARNNIDGALARLDSMAETTGRADIWRTRCGDILMQAGRRHDARVAYGQALAAIEALPLLRRRSRTARDLKHRLEAALRRRADTHPYGLTKRRQGNFNEQVSIHPKPIREKPHV